MAAPTPSARPAPGGTKLKDGFKSLVAFSADPDVSVWEKSITPPGWDGGDMIDQSTQHNTRLRTFSPRSLVTMTDGTIVCAYSPAAYPQLLAMLNVEQTLTNHFPNGGSLAWYGAVRVVEPGELVEGEQPEVTVTISPTNVDPATGEEEDPVYTPPSGAPMGAPSNDELEQMSLAELRRVAEAEQIETSRAMRKPNLIEAIQTERARRADEANRGEPDDDGDGDADDDD